MSLQAEWLFSETSGSSIADTSGNAVTGTLTGASVLTPGISGNAVWFNGTTGYMEAGNAVNIVGTSLTIMAWVRRLVSNGTMPILQRASAVARQFAFRWNGSGQSNSNKIQLTINDATTVVSSGAVPDDSRWHHLAATWDGSNVKFYIDGTLDSTVVLSATINNVAAAVTRLGTDAPRGATYTNAEFDNVRAYNDVQTGVQISTIYGNEMPTYTYSSVGPPTTSQYVPIAAIIGLFPSSGFERPTIGEVWPRDI